MKKTVLVMALVIFTITINAQWTNTGDNMTAGAIIGTDYVTARNPNNINATLALSWLNDVPRLRIGGDGNGVSKGFEIQTVGNRKLFKIDNSSNAFIYGNLGIGTTNPKEKLHLNGDFHADMGEGFKIFGDTNYFGQYLDGIVFQMEDVNGTNGNTDGGFVFRGHTTIDDKFKEWMVIKSGGNVGIGTTTPGAKLDVVGDAFVGDLNGRRYLRIASKEFPEIRFQTPTSDRQMRLGVAHANYASYGIEAGDLYVYSGVSGSMPLIVKKTADISLGFKKGNVGIGTDDTKGFKLAVNGKIVATEVKVATYANWSDFVFEKEYKLPTLNEVENHINKKGHLKDIPSAGEVKKEGFFLGEMDAKLLQKIEELTLYTIQQEKEIEVLKRQKTVIEKVKEKNKSLTERLNKLEKLVNKLL